MDNREDRYKGYWWLANNSDKKAAGIGSIDMHKGAEVEVIGSLISSSVLFNGPLNALSGQNLLGKTQKGLVTLIGVLVGSHNKHSSGISEGNYIADVGIVGPRHFLEKDNVVFDSVKIEFTLLKEWIGRSGIRIEDEIDSDGCLEEARVTYRFPETLESYVASIEARISTDYRYSLDTSFCDKRIQHFSYLAITPDTPQSFEWYSEKIESIRKLLMVLIGFPVSVLNITGFQHSEDKDDRPDEFQIYIRTSEGLLETSATDMYNMLTRLSSAKASFDTLLNTWFEKAEVLTPSVTLYTYNLSAKFVYSEFRLVNYVQALETLDRRLNGSKKPNPKKRIRRLLSDVWAGCLDQFIDSIDRFVDEVIATRNYAVHFNSHDNEKAYVVSGSSVFYLSERLKVLLITHILIQMGIPRETVYNAILRFSRFNYLKIIRRAAIS